MTEGWGGSWADEKGIISDDAQEQTPQHYISKGRPVKSDIGIPITDENPEYTKLLNEVITLRWKCGDQAAELAALRQPTQSDVSFRELAAVLYRKSAEFQVGLTVADSYTLAAEAIAFLQEQRR